MVVVYFAGHGVADGGSWDHFSIPGTFMYRGELLNTINANSAAMANVTLHAATLVAWLRDANVPFLVLLDNCYEGESWTFEAKPAVPQPDAPCPTDPLNASFCLELKKQLGPALKADEQAKAIAKNFNEMLASRRQSNRFENTYPVLFSTTPGTVVSTVADPFHQGAVTAVAPLARRAMIILTPAVNRGEPLSLKEFIQQMTAPNVDPGTQPAVTYSPLPIDAGLLFISKGYPKSLSESRIGTGTTGVVCCDQSQMLSFPPGPQ